MRGPPKGLLGDRDRPAPIGALASLWTSRCGRKEASCSSIASGGAILTSTRPGRPRWMESATAWRYISGERVTSTRIM